MDSIKDVVRSSVKVPEFEKYLKKTGRHIGRNVVEITIKMKTIVRKPLMMKIITELFSQITVFRMGWREKANSDPDNHQRNRITYFRNLKIKFFLYKSPEITEIQIWRKLILFLAVVDLREREREREKEREREREREQNGSQWMVSLKLLVFDLVLHCTEDRKQRKTTKIKSCEKAKRLHIISSCTKDWGKQAKPPFVIALRQMIAKKEKLKTYKRNC